MASKLQEYRRMSEEAQRQLTGSLERWQSFLATASRLYKYPYHEQVMIHAQRPDATACAEFDVWNNTMRRYVRRGSKGIALIDTSGDRERLRYVFDVSDTGTRPNSRSLNLWELREEHIPAVSSMLEKNYGVPAGESLAVQLEAVASQLAQEYWEDNRRDILGILEDSFLEEYDEFNVGVAFRNAAEVSISYNRWQGDIEKLSNRDRLCLDMDAALAKKPHDLEGFYSLMEQAGYTVTRGKNITFSHPRQKRNIRMRSLPEEYREDAIREVLAGRRIHNPRKRRSPLAEQKAQLVSALEAKQNQGRGHYYDLSIQNQITKQQARALLYYQQHGFTSADDFDAFAESVEAVKQRRDALSAQITSAEKRLNEIAVLQKHITNYLKTKDIYAGYRASGYSKAYYEEHEDAIKLCKASKRAFDELLPSDTSGKTAGSHKKQLPSLKALRAEYAELLAMKKAAYPEYYKAKDEYRELLTYQANLAGLFGIENVRSAPQREHQQEEK